MGISWLIRWQRVCPHLSVMIVGLMLALPTLAQTCYTSDDMDAASRTALLNTGKRYFDMASKGDSTFLKQNAIPSLASDFSGIETAVKDNQANFAGAAAVPRGPFLLKAEGATPLPRAEFLCGVFGSNGQTAHSAEFVIPNLSPGSYGIVILDVTTSNGPYSVTLVLQEQGADWKLGGYFVKAAQVAHHDANWYADQARAFKAKNQNRNAWLYYTEARELAEPVPFMYTQITDKLYDESQSVKPADLPVDGSTVDLAAGGKTYKLTAVFPLAVGQDLDVVVKYQAADVSNTGYSFQENAAVMKGLLAKYPDFRDAFAGVVARAVEPSGRDYGSLMLMKDIK
jgi:hypothetical protein